MRNKNTGRFAALLGSTVYVLIALEILIMISPFAAYFYSVYAPMLSVLSSSPVLSWTAEFFLPHMVFTRDPLIVALSLLQVLFIAGMVLFLFAAVPLYYNRIVRKRVATGGLYRHVRHPQYLALAVAGFGLLIYWPRFIILILYVTMIFVYYLLARNEEWRMKRAYGASYEEYLRRTPMFLPGEPGGRVFRLLFGGLRHQWIGIMIVYLVSLGFALGIAFGLRSYAANHIPRFVQDGRLIVPVYERPQEEVDRLYQAVLAHPEVQRSLGPDMNLAYLMPGDYFLMAIVTDEPRKFTEQVIASFPEVLAWHRHKFGGGPGQFLKIFYHYTRTLGKGGENDPDVERFIFVRVADRTGAPVQADCVLGIGLDRSAAMIVDVDAWTRQVLLVKPLVGGHKWGTIPMPVF